GLAETSPHNPLKVLHAKLEPPLGSKSSQPEVPVIGISNWRLDNSKSSRALLVQRPLFSEDDLVDTAKCLLGDSKIFNKAIPNFNNFLDKLAKAYLHYVEKQKYSNFHGLRDYYSLVKSIKSMNKEKLKENFYRNIQVALARNFGGTDNMDELFTIYFKAVLKPPNNLAYKYVPIPVQELIDINFKEKGARNLMLIGNSNSIVSLQIYRLRRRDIEPVVIIGSQFPDDKDGDDYSYAILNRIMICVETGSPLILTDLEIIYGSLYDLFNQNFLSEGNSSEDKKNFTRISLGPYSNPMLYECIFRCILVLDEEKLPYTDPPLLNNKNAGCCHVVDFVNRNFAIFALPEHHLILEMICQEGLDNLYEQPENLDNDDNLHPEVTKKFIENFSTNIQDTITTLTSEILQLARRLYFEDFIKICSANAGYLSEFDVQLLEFIFRRLCDNEILNDPVRLHIFWWDNSDAIVAELELARMCPSITELESNLPEDGDFGGYVINEIVNMMLGKIIVLKDDIIDELFIANYLSLWQRQVINVLSLCANIENSLESKILQFLRICNDLVSNQSINISDIIDTISLQLEPDPINILSQEFVGSALKLFDISATERNNTSQCSFFRRCFDIIPIDSTVRIHLYEVLFGQEPRTFIGSVLSRVLLLEEDLQEGIFINLIKNPTAVFGRSPRLKAINTALENSGIDSPIMALCCDVIQNDFFTELTFQDLKNNFKEAFNVLCSTNFEPLQLVLAVALLKEFVNNFWISLETTKTIDTEPITNDADIEEVIDKIDHAMKRQSSLIHSFRLYFLRSLYENGLSLHGIKCFCSIQSRIFQWLDDFNWAESNNKIGFIAYRCYDQYIEVEEAFNPLYSRGHQEQFENFLNQVSNNLSTSIKMSIMGNLITHLYDIRAIRGLRTNEEIAIQCLKDKLPNMHFDKFYIDKLLSFLENNDPLYSISPETNILGHFMSYECQCGYKYISGTVQKSNCPQCGSITEGVQCIVNLGKRCKAAQGLNGSNENITQTNLSQQMKNEINEFVDFDKSHVVGRSSIKMSKIPYRIFELVLKRFMFRYLSSELYDPDEKLAKYLSENCNEKHISDCWPFWVSNNVILDKFPKSLLVENIYNAYQYTIQNATKSNSHKTNNSFQNNNRQNKNQRNKTSNTTNTGTSSRNNRNRKQNEVDTVI
ncbi:11960_t:CDS:10, partial [Gigaspora rosea]